jgi:hypothetical protein
MVLAQHEQQVSHQALWPQQQRCPEEGRNAPVYETDTGPPNDSNGRSLTFALVLSERATGIEPA